jgi:hypothetical protein
MRKTLAAAGIVVLALTATGCGNNDGAKSAAARKAQAEHAKAAKSLSDKIVSSQKSGSPSQFFTLNRKDADCIGNGFVDKIGTGKLQKYGILNKNLKAKQGVGNVRMSAGDASSATAVFFGCVDVTSMVKKEIAKSGQIPKQMQPCVNKTLTDKNLRPVFSKVFEGKQQDAQKSLVQPMMKCAQGSGG